MSPETAPPVEVRTQGWARPLSPLLLVVFAVCAAYGPVFRTLVRQWSTIDVNSHGFLIPVIAGYLVWLRRAELLQIMPRPAYVSGWVCLLIGLTVLNVGRVSGIASLEEISLLPTLAGLVLSLRGWKALRLMSGAIGYLVFMMPLLDMAAILQPPLQRLAARGGSWLLELGGYPILTTDTLIVLPRNTLEVAAACSGINNLVATLAIGALIGMLAVSTWRGRLMFGPLAVFVALASNPLRVALIGWLLETGYDQYLPGEGHQVQGLTVVFLDVLVLLAFARTSERLFSPSAAGQAGEKQRRHAKGDSSHQFHQIGWMPACVCAAMLVVAALPGYAVRPVQSAPAPERSWPAAIAGWRAIDSTSEEVGVVATLQDGPGGRFYTQAGHTVGVFSSPLTSDGSADGWLEQLAPSARRDVGDVAVNVARIDHRRIAFDIVYWYDVSGQAYNRRIEARLRGGLSQLVSSRPPMIIAIVAPAAGIEPAIPTAFARDVLTSRAQSGYTEP